MEKLLVYEDFCETVAQLRSAYNRVINGLEGSTVYREIGDQCVHQCDFLYDFHMRQNDRVVNNLKRACEAREGQAINQALQVLNRHSRSLARLTLLFQENIADYHVDIDDPDLVLRQCQPQTPVDVQVMLGKLTNMASAIARAQEQQQQQQQQQGSSPLPPSLSLPPPPPPPPPPPSSLPPPLHSSYQGPLLTAPQAL